MTDVPNDEPIEPQIVRYREGDKTFDVYVKNIEAKPPEDEEE
jgi:hypothetical protein